MPTTVPLPPPPTASTNTNPNNPNIPAATETPTETGPPTTPLRRKAYKQHLHNERAAIKTHLDRLITTYSSSSSSPSFPSTSTSTSTSSFSSSHSSETNRWHLLQSHRAEKLHERVKRGKGSVQALFPEFWDAEGELAWLRRGWRGFLLGVGDGDKGRGGVGLGKGGLRVGRGEDRDDEEEVGLVVGVKKEEDGDEVGDAGLAWSAGRGRQVVGRDGALEGVEVEMVREGGEGGSIRGRLDGRDKQGRGLGRRLGRRNGEARLVNEAVVGVPCSRGWAIQDSSVEAMEELVDTTKTRSADVVLGFAGSRGALFEPTATGEAETDDFGLGSKRKAEDEMELPDKKIKLY
ncbi:hypothetical protein NU219Hw_g2189t1 [Hortaea werneckii]